ncbi:HAMP domain-containing sensor histidine kinase [Mangrovibacillus cuniculi]|uniref:Signal transduction histidine-protein kinase ArlS n=1 Tax=Mangrovibacillus cuniculi TaxID=2593652 RepID=A0A7S8HFI7_9BACI|nr:HAMP domain-containing histidine kinase [Mangrovibacillus cuniculi]QPC46566.1 HAMP domain-containing histidine kinase [Mangrovibacillus cuniculi]
MKKLIKAFKQSSIKVKWSIVASSVIFLTFFLYSFGQYVLIQNWMIREEERNVRQVLDDLTVFYQQRGPVVTMEDIYQSRELINQINERNQTIRIIANDGREVFSVKSSNRKTDYLLPFKPIKDREIQKYQTGKENIIVGRSPITSTDFNGYVEVIHPLNRFQTMMDRLFGSLLLFGAAALFVSAMFGFLLARQFLQPLKRLSNTMAAIQKGGFQKRLDVGEANDEIAELTRVFNHMMQTIEHNFSQQKRFVEDASHELRTPIQVLEGHLNLVNRWGKNDPEVLEESLDASLQELKRLKHLVDDLLTLTRAEREDFEQDAESNLEDTIESVLKNLRLVYPKQDYLFQKNSMLPHTAIHFSEHHLQQLLIILLDNAVKYGGGKPITLSLKEENDFFTLAITDKGEGIPKEDVPKLFHRFYRVDKARSRNVGGNGLGLSIAKRLMEGHMGHITIESELGVGTTVYCFFKKIDEKNE